MARFRLPKFRLSLKARYFVLINLVIVVFAVVIIFSLISFVGLGRGDVLVLVGNYTEAPLTVVAPGQTKILAAFEVWALELDLVGSAKLETSHGNLEIVPGRSPVVYSWLIGSPAVTNHCLAQTRLSLDRNYIGTEFAITGERDHSTQTYRFDLPLNRLWWPAKQSAAALPTSSNPNADYTFIFPVDCETTNAEQLLPLAKFWLNYNADQLQEEYQKLQDLISDDPAYNDPGPT